jgi:glycosyltransferase involved in cell wall biosynthesis
MTETVLTVVIPTYNRGERLVATVAAVLASDLSDQDRFEVVVVDDGSSLPAADVLGTLGKNRRITLEVIRQTNAGPAAARNAGFRRAQGRIVLFLDDDILVPPDLLRKHLQAHEANPGAIICGLCKMKPPAPSNAVYRLHLRIGGERPAHGTGGYSRVSTVASGQLSIERTMFDAASGVYSNRLVTPGAEEYELSARLRRLGRPILFAEHIRAIHDSECDIGHLCTQQYKHGLGCGEVARRYPDTLQLDELARIVLAHSPGRSRHLSGTVLRGLKSVVGKAAVRQVVLQVARAVERAAPQADVFGPLYRLAIAAHFTAGVRDGLARFANDRP